MKIYSPTSIIFPLGIALGEYDTHGWIHFHISWNPHAMTVLLYRMKQKKHIHVKYCWQAYSKSIGTLSHTFKNHIHNSIVAVACKWCVLSVSDVFLSKDDNSGGKTREISEGMAMIFISRNMIVVLCDHLFWFLPIVQSN